MGMVRVKDMQIIAGGTFVPSFMCYIAVEVTLWWIDQTSYSSWAKNYY